jgi:hypothetical protein
VELLRSSGGAVAAVGSTGLDDATAQSVLAGGTKATGAGGTHYFAGYLARGKSVGEALELAKRDLWARHGGNAAYTDVVDSYEVIGDPMLTLRGVSQ